MTRELSVTELWIKYLYAVFFQGMNGRFSDFTLIWTFAFPAVPHRYIL